MIFDGADWIWVSGEGQKGVCILSGIRERLRLKNSKSPISITAENGGKYFLIDLGEKNVGLLKLKFTSLCAQKIRVDRGEDLQDGHGAHNSLLLASLYNGYSLAS